jgi:BlaI family penicillinase repressor
MKLTEAEWLIMNALWHKHPAKARDIAGRLPKEVNWAYTTIKTMLTRLVEKKAVAERKQGNASVYEPLVSKQKAQRSALRTLANQAFDGAFGPLMHFLLEQQKLTAKQRRELMEVLHSGGERKGERK